MSDRGDGPREGGDKDCPRKRTLRERKEDQVIWDTTGDS